MPERLNLDYDYVLSSSWWTPATTLPAMLGLLAMIAAMIGLAPRRRLAAFILAWFLGNLALESFVLPLAVIFEHRTYLPSMLLPPPNAWLLDSCMMAPAPAVNVPLCT